MQIKFKPQILFTVLAALLIASGLVKASFLLKENKSEAQNKLGANTEIYGPYKLEGFGRGWMTAPEFDGKNMPDDALVEATNIDFNVKNSISPRQGTIILGSESSSSTPTPIMSMHTSTSIKGRELLIRTYSTVVEWWNPINETWENLDSSYTSGKTFSFADGNNSSETEVYTYFSNGSEAIKRFRIAFGSVSSNATTTITLNSISGLSDATELGFNSAGGTVRVNSTNYTYSGTSGWQLTGLSALPTFTGNAGVISAVETTGFASAPTSSVSLVINKQRLYAAYKNSVYCSKIDDLQDFGSSAPRVASEGEIVFFPDGGDKINALAVRPNYVAIFKDNYIGSLEFKDFGDGLSDIPVVNTVAKEIDIGATNANAVTNKGFSVFFSSDDIGMSELTRLENKDYDESNQISEMVRPTLEDYTFSNSAIISFDGYILEAANDGETDFNNKIIVFDDGYNRLTEFQGMNANAFAVYDGKLYYGDSVNPNTYQLFYENYDDNGLPYTTRFKTKWYNFGEETRWKELGWVFIEGFINQNTTLTFTINLDEGGRLGSKAITISGTGDYVSQQTSSGFGTNPFGLVNFSNIAGSADNLLHFAGYINTDDLFGYKFRNIQFQGETSGTGQNYRILRIIPFYHVLDENWGRSYQEYLIP